MNVHIKLSSEGMVGIVEGWDQQDGKHSQTPQVKQKGKAGAKGFPVC